MQRRSWALCVRALLALALVEFVAALQRPHARAQDLVRNGGTLVGVVRDTGGQGLHLVSVVVGLDRPRTTLTDSLGNFRLEGLPAGVQSVLFRRIGFAPARFALLVPVDDSINVTVELTPTSIELRTLEVAGRAVYADLQLAGFYERERQARDGAGVGRFITPEEIEQLRSLGRTTRILETAGVRLLQGDRQVYWAVGRANMILRGDMGRLLTGPCQMAAFVDGIEVDLGRYFDQFNRSSGLDGLVHPGDIRAIEVYLSASGTPQQFQSVRNAQCGAIVIWTKSGPQRRPQGERN